MTEARFYNADNCPEHSKHNGKMARVVIELPRTSGQKEPRFEVMVEGDLFVVGLSCLPDFKTSRIAEIVFDMTTCAMNEIRHRTIKNPDFEFEDSRELCWNIIEWAEEFENQYDSEEDYILCVERFAYAKLAEYL